VPPYNVLISCILHSSPYAIHIWPCSKLSPFKDMYLLQCQATFNFQVPSNLHLMSLWVQFISTINCSSVNR